MVKYYPKPFSIAKLIKEFPAMEWVNYAEEQRLQDLANLKARGKGAPKKTKKGGTVFWTKFSNIIKS
jgi:small subunit ribosomal protein S33